MIQARSLINYGGSLILATFLALIIWATATQAQDPIANQFIQLEVDFVGQPENSVLLRPERESVQLRIEGPQSILQQITPADFKASVDLSQVAFGTGVTMPIRVSTPVEDIELSEPIPAQVEVELEQQVLREVPVELDIRGSVARGHIQGEPLIEPSKITVSGPASQVELLDFALATVFLNDAQETKVGEHRPIFYDESGQVASTINLNLSNDAVQVTIPVEESEGFSEKVITVDWTGEPARGYRLLSVEVDPPTVVVSGLPQRVNEITRLTTEEIDINGLDESDTQQVTLKLPEGIRLDQEQDIFATFEIEPIRTTDTRLRKVETLGLDENVEAILDPEEVRVIIYGPLPVLDTLLDEDVLVTVDLFGLDTGTYSLEPAVVLPDRGLETRSLRPQAITVTITRTITMTEEITGTIPITETNNILLKFIAGRSEFNMSNNNQGEPKFNDLGFPRVFAGLWAAIDNWIYSQTGTELKVKT